MADEDLKPSVWKDINEAVGEALKVSPPDPAQDRVEGAPPHGTSGPQMVEVTEGEITAQDKLPQIGVRYQRISQEMADALDAPPPIPDGEYVPGPAKPMPIPEGTRWVTAVEARRVFVEEQARKAKEELDRENLRRQAQGMPVFHPTDGSLLGEYAPMQGDATTPDTVDGLWWLGLPEKRAIWELGIDPKDYPRVHRDVSVAAAFVINRRAQTGIYIPLVMRRKRRRLNAALFQGGTLMRIKGIKPNQVPRTPRSPQP